jgi:UPF0755 protein
MRKYAQILSLVLLGIIAVAALLWWQSSPPSDFPKGVIVKVPKESSASYVTNTMKDNGVIRSKTMLSLGLLFFGGGHKVLAGDYLFAAPQSSWTIAKRLVEGRQGLEMIKITIPEGATVNEIALIISQKIKGFDVKKFNLDFSIYEGYLFPETYYFLPNVTQEEIVDIMSEEFDNKLEEAEDVIVDFGRSLEDVIIMASILEEEARTIETKRVIAGILWKRLEKGMPLQVDAPFAYAIGKSTYDLTVDDLAADSPYNTYKYKGLPKGPITNPGLESIIASVTPVDTDYWYYLNDREGNMHYAAEYDTHLANKAKYVQ